MSAKIALLFLLIAYTKAQDNELCPCDTKDSKEVKGMLNILLEKLSIDVNNDDEKQLYSVYPGLLNEYECDCEEKMRRKRKITPELPTELISEQISPDPEETLAREKKYIHAHDRRCPLGQVKFLGTCFPADDLEDY